MVHDYLREYGGAERVLEVLHAQFPDAPVFVGVWDPASLGEHAARFAQWDIRTTWIERLPAAHRLVSPYRVFAGAAFASLDLEEYDVVISSTNMYMAKAVRTRQGARHISYIHTPPRSLYGLSTRSDWRSNPLLRVAGSVLNVWMRRVDFTTAQGPDILVANSRTTQERIRQYYQRDSQIIPPPVAMVDRAPRALPMSAREYLLFVGRMAHSKHPELAVQVAQQLQLPLKMVGVGPMRDTLQSTTDHHVEWLGSVSDEELQSLYQRAKLVLFPAEDEDFGIVPIEALACGTPVVAHYSGEPRFSIQHQQTGWHVHTLESRDWVLAVRQALAHRFVPQDTQAAAQPYSAENFQQAIAALITQ